MTPLVIALLALVVVAVVVGAVLVARRRRPSSTGGAARATSSAPPTRVGPAPPGLGAKVRALFGRAGDSDVWRQLEDVLISADVGPRAASDLVGRVRAKLTSGEDPVEVLRGQILEILGPDAELDLPAGKLAVILVVGVNGAGKTTTIGKLASRLRTQGKSVSLAGSDTFRAAAGEQLEVWAERAEAHLVSQDRGADPGAVVFDAVKSATARGSDVLIVDTAGRLHTKTPLMDELSKLRRVVDKAGAEVDETFLVLDATTGQNGIAQATAFTGAVGVTGIVLTKFDGSAKGGTVLAVVEELGIPVRFVGVGEGQTDLEPFVARTYVDRLVGA